jgi:hypothetical protein
MRPSAVCRVRSAVQVLNPPASHMLSGLGSSEIVAPAELKSTLPSDSLPAGLH